MKKCRRCQTEKSADLFTRSKTNRDGLASYCKACYAEYNRIRQRSGKPSTPESRKYARLAARKYRYGITQEQFDSMMAAQEHACAICRVGFDENLKPNIDHDHNCCPGTVTCGECVRGILCSGCNAFAGMIETRFATLANTFLYLRLHLESYTDRVLIDRATLKTDGGVK